MLLIFFDFCQNKFDFGYTVNTELDKNAIKAKFKNDYVMEFPSWETINELYIEDIKDNFDEYNVTEKFYNASIDLVRHFIKDVYIKYTKHRKCIILATEDEILNKFIKSLYDDDLGDKDYEYLKLLKDKFIADFLKIEKLPLRDTDITIEESGDSFCVLFDYNGDFNCFDLTKIIFVRNFRQMWVDMLDDIEKMGAKEYFSKNHINI